MRRIPRQLALVSTAFACMLALVACGSSAPVLQFVTISPVSGQAQALAGGGTCGGDMVNFTASAYYSDGSIKDGTSLVTWSSSDTTVATISVDGVASAISPGTTTITATAAGTPGATSNLTVIAASQANLAISPGSTAIALGSSSSPTTQQYTLTGTFGSGGGTEDLTTTAAWASSNTAVATIGASTGLATAVALGTTDISATVYCVTVPPTTTPNILTITAAAAMARFAYVANIHDSSISEYAVNGSSGTPSGVLSPLGKFSEPNGPQQVLLHPSGKFLYSLGSDSSQSVTLFDVDPTSGGLTSSGKVYTTTGSTLGSRAAIDAGGNYLYVANASANSITEFSINQADGTLTSLSTIGANLSNPTFLLVDNSGPYLYAINAGNQSLSGYTINTGKNKPAPGPAGTLTPIASKGTVSMTATDSFTSAAIDPTGSFIYVPDGHGNVEAVTIGTGGALASLTGTPFPVAGSSETRSAVVSPTATFLYVLDGSTSSPGVYILPLTAGKPGAASSHVSTGPAPSWIAADVTGSLISVVNGGNNTLSTFTIGKGGALTDSGFNPETAGSAEGMAFYTGTAEPTIAPVEVVAANSGSGNGTAFTAGAGGTLTIDPAMGHYSTFAGGTVVATSSLANLVATGGLGAAQVAAFTTTPSNASAFPATAPPTAVSGSPFNISPATARPSAISIDATGTFIIAADTANGVVYGFSRSSSGSNTTPVFTAGVAGVQALAVDPQGTLIYALTSTGVSVALFKQASPGSTAFRALSGTGVPGNWTVGGVDATGHFLVAFNSTAKAFSSFTITPVTGTSSDGALALEHADPAIIAHVTSFAFDPLGRYLMTADAVSNTVTAYGFTPSTTATNLTALAGSAAITLPSTPGGSPGQIAFDPSGQYLFIALSGVASGGSLTSGAVDVYTTNVKVGAPAFSEVKGAPFSAGTTSNALSTLGVGVIDSVQ